MRTGFRIVAALPGLMMLLLGVGWVTDPAGAAEGLGMPLLEGAGRSTQIGDFASFFLAGSVMVLMGVWTLRREWLLAPALLLGGAALMRTVAFAVYDAPFATGSIVAEVIMAGMLAAAAIVLPNTSEEHPRITEPT